MSALIVGLNNPLSSSPSDALVPWPAGCTGHRLFELIVAELPSFTIDDYCNAFERTNLWPGRELPTGRLSTAQLRAQGRSILKSIQHGPRPRTIVLLGPRVWTSVLATSRTPLWFAIEEHHGRSFVYMPHPSGRNLLFNNPRIKKQAGELLAAIAKENLP